MQIQQATEIARRLNMVGPVAEQPHYSMLHRERFEAEYEPLWRYENFGRLVCSKDWDGRPNLYSVQYYLVSSRLWYAHR